MELNNVYLFQLTGNVSCLYPMARALLALAPVTAESTERAKGMQVYRDLRRVNVPSEVDFPGAKQLIGVHEIRIEDDGSVETEDRVFITAVPWEELSSNELHNLVRLHWVIENGCNWTALPREPLSVVAEPRWLTVGQRCPCRSDLPLRAS